MIPRGADPISRRAGQVPFAAGVVSAGAGLIPLVASLVSAPPSPVAFDAGQVPFFSGPVSPLSGFVALVAGLVPLDSRVVPSVASLVPPVTGLVSTVPGFIPLVARVVPLGTGLIPIIARMVPIGTGVVPIVARMVQRFPNGGRDRSVFGLAGTRVTQRIRPESVDWGHRRTQYPQISSSARTPTDELPRQIARSGRRTFSPLHRTERSTTIGIPKMTWRAEASGITGREDDGEGLTDHPHRPGGGAHYVQSSGPPSDPRTG